jgi:hypothetical protein
MGWENGAGRIPNDHTRIHSLLHKYAIPTVPLSKEQVFRPSGTSQDQKDPWPAISSTILSALRSLPPTVLATHTIHQLLDKLFDKEAATRMELGFPYRSELKTLRADLALRTLISGTLSMEEGFTVAPTGLSSLITAIQKDLEKKGVRFLYGHRLLALAPEYTFPMGLKFEIFSKGTKKTEFKTITATKCILALHASALRDVNPFQNYPILKHLQMDPLLRTYAIFPSSRGKSWLSGIPRTVTDSPIRFFIPVQPSKGVAMVSYTEKEDAQKWMTQSDVEMREGILTELRRLFPEHSIPNPLFFKHHPWKDGCTYWLPGLYNPEEESKKILRPLPTRWPHLYVCGESFSLCQTWMEGALEHAELLCKTYFDC